MRETVVLLHGFAGTGRGWDPVVAELDAQRYTALAPDLRGHGSQSATRPVTFDAITQDVLDAAPPRFQLGGYSMGGRIALHVALAAPERITRLILVATTAGIDDAHERTARHAADEALAHQIETFGIETFADRWLAQPLFAADPAVAQERARADIARNEPAGLAASLHGVGTGSMAPLWSRLHELTMPVLVLTGAHDTRFTEVGRRLLASLPDAALVVIPDAGHALTRVAPEAVAQAINDR